MSYPQNKKPSPPTHRISVAVPIEGSAKSKWHRIGAAWLNPVTKAITIKIDPLVDYAKLSRFPTMQAFPVDTQHAAPSDDHQGASDALGDDDIPF